MINKERFYDRLKFVFAKNFEIPGRRPGISKFCLARFKSQLRPCSAQSSYTVKYFEGSNAAKTMTMRNQTTTKRISFFFQNHICPWQPKKYLLGIWHLASALLLNRRKEQIGQKKYSQGLEDFAHIFEKLTTPYGMFE